MQPIYTWWNSFTAVMSNYFAAVGPREYSYILVLTGIAGYLFLKSGSSR